MAKNIYKDLGEEGLGLDVEEGDGHAGGLRGEEPGVGAGQRVVDGVVAGVGAVERGGEDEQGEEAAGAGHRQHLLHLLLPRVGHVAVLQLRLAQRAHHPRAPRPCSMHHHRRRERPTSAMT